MNDQEIFQKIAELKDQGNAVCLATIVEAAGSTPREAGAKMILCAMELPTVPSAVDVAKAR